MSAMADGASYLCVFIVQNSGKYHVDVSHWDEIDAAMQHWAERRIDRVLSLMCSDGGALLVPASRIGEMAMSTPAIRERSRELTNALKAEEGFAEP